MKFLIVSIFLALSVSPAFAIAEGEVAFVPSQKTLKARSEYTATIASLLKYRNGLKIQLRNHPDQKKQIISAARNALMKTITENIFPAWQGTTWAFEGTTEKPGEGAIACGYFVSTVLKHAGFEFPRNKMAQQNSPDIIQSFAEKEFIKTSAGINIDKFLQRLAPFGDGLYIVGLDSHVGFILVNNGAASFIHSSYYPKNVYVVIEPAQGSNPLADSDWRMVGKILGDSSVEKWIKGEALEVHKH